MERRRLSHVFVKQFVVVFKNWEPVESSHLPETSSTTVQPAQHLSQFNDTVIGCNSGHPPDIILMLIEEVTQVTTFVTESKLELLSIVR